MTRRLFGTDGIRGKVIDASPDEEASINALHEQRVISTTLLRIVGEALGRTMDQLPGEGTKAVIGWDDRPKNTELVAALTLGLRLTGCTVVHVGMCATPALHRATLRHQARIGCMVTASHNPVSDSGLKVFDSLGYKTNPQYEDFVSNIADALASEEREIDVIDEAELSQPSQPYDASMSAANHHPSWLSERYAHFQILTGTEGIKEANVARPFVIDASKGAAHTWLANWLSEQGLESIEVSGEAQALNLNCGAGDFSPTQTWTFEEASNSPHMLLQNLTPSSPGHWSALHSMVTAIAASSSKQLETVLWSLMGMRSATRFSLPQPCILGLHGTLQQASNLIFHCSPQPSVCLYQLKHPRPLSAIVGSQKRLALHSHIPKPPRDRLVSRIRATL